MDACLPQAHLVDDAVEDARRELAEPVPHDAQGRFTSRGPTSSKEAAQPAVLARMEVCLLARELVDQAARLVIVQSACTPEEATDEEYLAETIRQVSTIIEDLQNRAVAYLDKQGWDQAKIAQALDQQGRLIASRRTPPRPRIEPKQLDHWLARYRAVRADSDWPEAESPSAGLRRVGIHAELRHLDADPRSPADELVRVHKRRVELYAELIRSTKKSKNPAEYENLLKAMKNAKEAVREAQLDLRHARPSPEVD
ncbi:hypothetical protein [Microbispora sp. H13382]|uniref:hypothetical protein n=1 Tax=Microbispora sp. H13382 TaxID=2729112 RepID=UPI00160041F8|nr:hypothetical protein [Microbispora sp. H13382]